MRSARFPALVAFLLLLAGCGSQTEAPTSGDRPSSEGERTQQRLAGPPRHGSPGNDRPRQQDSDELYLSDDADSWRLVDTSGVGGEGVGHLMGTSDGGVVALRTGGPTT